MNHAIPKLLISVLLTLTIPALAEETPPSEPGTPSSSVQIDINNAKIRKSLIAFPPLQTKSTTPNAEEVSARNSLQKIILQDLEVSTYFDFISEAAAPLKSPEDQPSGFSAGDTKDLQLESWKQRGAEFLITSTLTLSKEDLVLDLSLFSVGLKTSLLTKTYKHPKSALRTMAHSVANDLMEAMTGTKGIFLSRIVAVSDQAGSGFKEVYVMDWDGENAERLTHHNSVCLSPAFSPDGSKVAYTVFVQRAKTKTRNADLFLVDLKSQKSQQVSYKDGLNSGAAFSPDGKNLFLTLSQSGNSDIFKKSLETGAEIQITHGPRGAMNVEPAISPDGKKIAFSSDRAGNTMIYVMDIDGSNPKRLTFAGKFNASPSWSPDGKRIAFAGWNTDHFDIYTVTADGAEMTQITSAKKADGKWAQNEDPVFSADGRLILYTSNRTGSHQIFVSNIQGTEEHRITNDQHNYFKPKWSPNREP